MKNIHASRIVCFLVLFVCNMFLPAVQAAPQSEANTQKNWHSKSGRVWELSVDEKGRIHTFKNSQSGGHKMHFKYQGDSGKPTAMKIGDNKWYFQPTTAPSQLGFWGECAIPGKSGMLMPAVNSPTGRGGLPASIALFSFKKTYHLGEPDPIEQSYQDFQWLIADLSYQIQWQIDDWEFNRRREICVQACDDVTDLAWIGCGAFASLGLIGGAIGGAVGAIAGLGCAAIFYNEREKCRLDCSRRY